MRPFTLVRCAQKKNDRNKSLTKKVSINPLQVTTAQPTVQRPKSALPTAPNRPSRSAKRCAAFSWRCSRRCERAARLDPMFRREAKLPPLPRRRFHFLTTQQRMKAQSVHPLALLRASPKDPHVLLRLACCRQLHCTQESSFPANEHRCPRPYLKILQFVVNRSPSGRPSGVRQVYRSTPFAGTEGFRHCARDFLSWPVEFEQRFPNSQLLKTR